jgi:hypothetical protein
LSRRREGGERQLKWETCESVLGGEEGNGEREGRVSGAELQAGEMRSEVLALASLLHGGAAGASCGKRESAMA